MCSKTRSGCVLVPALDIVAVSKQWVLNQLSRMHMGSQKLKSQAWCLHGSAHCPTWVCTLSSACYDSELGVFVRLLTMGLGVSMTPFFISWDSFPPIGLHCSASVWRLFPCLSLFFVLVDCPLLKACFFADRGEEG